MRCKHLKFSKQLKNTDSYSYCEWEDNLIANFRCKLRKYVTFAASLIAFATHKPHVHRVAQENVEHVQFALNFSDIANIIV